MVGYGGESVGFPMGLNPSPMITTFPQASLRSRTVGFPESGSDLGATPHYSRPIYCAKRGFVDEVVPFEEIRRYIKAREAPGSLSSRPSTSGSTGRSAE